MTKYNRAYTFIYYKDIKEAEPFYRDLLGLKLEYESDWVVGDYPFELSSTCDSSENI